LGGVGEIEEDSQEWLCHTGLEEFYGYTLRCVANRD